MASPVETAKHADEGTDSNDETLDKLALKKDDENDGVGARSPSIAGREGPHGTPDPRVSPRSQAAVDVVSQSQEELGLGPVDGNEGMVSTDGNEVFRVAPRSPYVTVASCQNADLNSTLDKILPGRSESMDEDNEDSRHSIKPFLF